MFYCMPLCDVIITCENKTKIKNKVEEMLDSQLQILSQFGDKFYFIWKEKYYITLEIGM